MSENETKICLKWKNEVDRPIWLHDMCQWLQHTQNGQNGQIASKTPFCTVLAIYKIRAKGHFIGEPNQRHSDQKSQKSQKCRKPSLKTTLVDFGSDPTTYGLYTHPPKSIFFSKWYFYTVGRGIKIAEFSRFRQKSHFARGRKERHRG